MEINNLIPELVQQILDRAPFADWLLVLPLVCKKWMKLCITSTCDNRVCVLSDEIVKASCMINSSAIRDIISKYRAIGLDISDLTRYSLDVPLYEVITGLKHLKWLSINERQIEQLALSPKSFDIERLGIFDKPNWIQNHNINTIASFLQKFPKVRTFSASPSFSIDRQKVEQAPINTEVLHIMFIKYSFFNTTIENYLADLTDPTKLPNLKKVILTHYFADKLLNPEALHQFYVQLEDHMRTTRGIRLIVRNPFYLVRNRELFIDALKTNGLPYDYYTFPKNYTKGHYTLFCHACNNEALDTMKYLIESGITSLEKELELYPLPYELHDRMHSSHLLPNPYHPFLVPVDNFRDLTDQRKEILDYLIILGLNSSTKGRNGEHIFKGFGVAHPVVEYVILRSKPPIAASTLYTIISTMPAHYKTYMSLYDKLSEEAQDELKQLLVDFDFTNVIYYVIESRDLQTIKHVVEEFNIDMNKYEDTYQQL